MKNKQAELAAIVHPTTYNLALQRGLFTMRKFRLKLAYPGGDQAIEILVQNREEAIAAGDALQTALGQWLWELEEVGNDEQTDN
jgi:hypothetical protein